MGVHVDIYILGDVIVAYTFMTFCGPLLFDDHANSIT